LIGFLAFEVLLGEAKRREVEEIFKPGMDRHSLKIVIISDTHELHREIEVPPADILPP
jgi:hypothetical protein